MSIPYGIQEQGVLPMATSAARAIAQAEHYLHRKPPCSYAFQMGDCERVLGIVTFGTPPSRHLQVSACKSAPEKVIELNRLWVHDDCPKNTESWFVSRALKLLPPRIVVSYADTAWNHVGYIYRALNFFYAGLTDAERKTPRFDYITEGKHSRDTTRNGTDLQQAKKVRRKPKHKYWTVTGDRREQRALLKIATWPKLDWRECE